MRRWRILGLGLLAAMLAVGFIAWPRGPAEPVYKGERLSEWLKVPGPNVGVSAGADRLRAQRVLDELGTNALPWLMHEFTRPISEWRKDFNKLAGQRLRSRWLLDDGRMRIHRAGQGLEMLGPAVTQVLPELAQHLSDSVRGGTAARAMAGAGEPALPWLVQGMASTNVTVQVSCLFGLSRLGATVPAAIPPLLQALHSTNGTTQRLAFSIARSLRSRPDWTIAAFQEALSGPDPSTQARAAEALKYMRRFPSEFRFELLRLQQGTNLATVLSASNALRFLDP